MPRPAFRSASGLPQSIVPFIFSLGVKQYPIAMT
jgi:hypothetical protein